MRMRDNGSSNKTAWRITVRQLESLIRLAEALARMFCKDLVILILHSQRIKTQKMSLFIYSIV